MPLYDWNSSLTNAQGALQASVVLDGTQSLLCNPIQGNAQMRFFWSRLTGGGYTAGLTKGRMRTLLRLDDISVGAGFVFMASSTNVAVASGNFYEAGKRGGVNEVFIARITGGLVSFSSSSNVAAYTFAVNTPYALQVDWIADAVNLGGVLIELSVGTAVDFSNLVRVTAWMDSSASKLLTTVAEGIGGAWNVVPVRNTWWDATSIASLS